VDDSPEVEQLCFAKPLESEVRGHGANSDEPLFLKQLVSGRTDIPAPLALAASVC
jgi:hypothetical protein